MGSLPPKNPFLKIPCFNTKDPPKAVWLLLTFQCYFQSQWHVGSEQRKSHPFDDCVHLTARYSHEVKMQTQTRPVLPFSCVVPLAFHSHWENLEECAHKQVNTQLWELPREFTEGCQALNWLHDELELYLLAPRRHKNKPFSFPVVLQIIGFPTCIFYQLHLWTAARNKSHFLSLQDMMAAGIMPVQGWKHLALSIPGGYYPIDAIKAKSQLKAAIRSHPAIPGSRVKARLCT